MPEQDQKETQSFTTIEGALTDVEVNAKDVPTRADVRRSVDRVKRDNNLAIIICIIIVLVISMASFAIGYFNSKSIAASSAIAALDRQSLQSLKEANDKLIAQGLPPIPVPPSGNTVDANALAQAAAALVLADPRFAGLTITDLRKQVDAYFAMHPLPEGQKPTPDQVISAVSQIYAANPPRPGRPPTPDEIVDAVSAFCANGFCQGTPGAEGKQGPQGNAAPAVTADEIYAQVTKFCGNNPKSCKGDAGPKGDTGLRGVGVVSFDDPKRDAGGHCIVLARFTEGPPDPIRVPDSFCPIIG